MNGANETALLRPNNGKMRSSRVIFRVGNRLQYGEFAPRAIELRASRIRGRALPVRHARRCVRSLPGLQADSRAALYRVNTSAFFAEDYLSAFMHMPLRLRTRREKHMSKASRGVILQLINRPVKNRVSRERAVLFLGNSDGSHTRHYKSA